MSLPVLAQSGNSQISKEIARLRQINEQPFSSPDFPDLKATTATFLKGAEDALTAGDIYVALERLGQVEDMLAGARNLIEKADTVKDSLPAFEAEWGKASLRLAALDKELQSRGARGGPAAVAALMQAARVKAIPLLDGGRGFATATKPKDGLFYVGQAQGEAEFARFCASMKLMRRGRPFVERSFLPELLALQEKVNAAFKPPKSIDLHPRFISLNATIKLARELDAAKYSAGAMYQYLEALRHYGMLDAPELDVEGQAKVKSDVAMLNQRLASSRDDDSIAEILAQRAALYTAHPDGSPPSKDEWRSARLIVDQVIPAYYSARQSRLAAKRIAGKTVTLTLVRWPYT